MSKYNYEEIKKLVLDFGKDRNWQNSPQNIAKSIIIEAAELLEHFQWDEKSHKENPLEGKNLKEIEFEAADIFWYLLDFCNVAGFDLLEAVKKKYEHNSIKYPIDKKDLEGFYLKQKKDYRNKKDDE